VCVSQVASNAKTRLFLILSTLKGLAMLRACRSIPERSRLLRPCQVRLQSSDSGSGPSSLWDSIELREFLLGPL
jgi:hypothetical protein